MKYYKLIYGNGTHSLRTFNLILAMMWITLIFLDLAGNLKINLPVSAIKTVTHFHWLGITLLATVGLTALSFIIKNWEGVLIRFFALTLGGLSQALLAMRFSSVYPPLDTMSLVCAVFSVWLLGGAFYVAKDKQINGEAVGDTR